MLASTKDAATSENSDLRKAPPGTVAVRAVATAGQALFAMGKIAAGTRTALPAKIRAAKQARNSFAHLGPTYVKLGQLIASSPGVFPEVLSAEFRSLLDRVPPADPVTVRALITAELGAPPEDIFAHFDIKPFASASIAQVHRATLRTGEDVVVKIQRPGIKRRLAADLEILRGIANMLELSEYGRMANAKDIIDDFTITLRQEVNFQNEAQAMKDMWECWKDTELADRVRIPKTYDELCTPRVLTMEFVEGTRIDNVAAIQGAGHDGERIIKSLLLLFLESAFNGGIFHGDLHAGNLLIDSQGKIIMLDFGIVGRFNEEARTIIRQMLFSLMVTNDFVAVGEGLYKLGAIGKPTTDRKEITHSIRNITEPISKANLGAVSYGKIGVQLAEVAKVYQAKLPRDLVLVGKQLLYVERYMKLLAPQWQPITDNEVLTAVMMLMNTPDEDDEEVTPETAEAKPVAAEKTESVVTEKSES